MPARKRRLVSGFLLAFIILLPATGAMGQTAPGAAEIAAYRGLFAAVANPSKRMAS